MIDHNHITQGDTIGCPACDRREKRLQPPLPMPEQEEPKWEPMTPPPDVFETYHDERHIFPFFETEDADIVGGGHHDKTAFAMHVTEYDRLVSGEDYTTTAADVEWRYAVAELKNEEWWFTWARGGERVTSTTPGAIAITLVER